MKTYFKSPMHSSLKREKGFFYCEVLDGEITRHMSVFGDSYSWAILRDNFPPDYLFTEDPTFGDPISGDEQISKEEFDFVWEKAGGPEQLEL